MKPTRQKLPIIIILLLIIMSLISSGCASTDHEEEITLTVGAASDLYYAFKEAAEVFEDKHDIKIDFNFGSTGLLYQQIAQGAPIDLYAAADEKHVLRLLKDGLVNKDDHSLYALGRLVIATPSAEIRTLEELTKEEVEVISIANPEHAPYGKAAKEALKNKGLWEELSGKLVFGSNIRDAQRYLERDEVDAAILALSLMKGNDHDFEYHLIEEELHERLNQRMALINTSQYIKEGRKFLEFITKAEEGRKIMERYGFIIP